MSFVRAQLTNSLSSKRAKRSTSKTEQVRMICAENDSFYKLLIMLALPSASEYSDDTYRSWTTLKYLNAASATLAVAALMMTLCGALSAGLSFYIMYTMGRRYYLDFGVLSGFTCLLLGLLGFRSRKYQLLPNRNYISGYIVLSVFSLFSAACLLILLCAQPRPGSALNDVSGGAVCALSALSLALASLGVFTSYCCRHPPPDNRVANGRTKWY
ncbi:hypothetical protein EVAR_96554_1 [Eumeta japonica]|uniref:Uncharacterized protein n=1 Tax=Eumeta variegata TaxID=151549 RepID=A0A4C1WCX8_EUMVA|nr:hypothetical protein EVAR_96554_1 [Eumeta japonica]